MSGRGALAATASGGPVRTPRSGRCGLHFAGVAETFDDQLQSAAVGFGGDGQGRGLRSELAESRGQGGGGLGERQPGDLRIGTRFDEGQHSRRVPDADRFALQTDGRRQLRRGHAANAINHDQVDIGLGRVDEMRAGVAGRTANHQQIGALAGLD